MLLLSVDSSVHILGHRHWLQPALRDELAQQRLAALELYCAGSGSAESPGQSSQLNAPGGTLPGRRADLVARQRRLAALWGLLCRSRT
eukprot:21135-Heterococcus_DN1.PRE.3